MICILLGNICPLFSFITVSLFSMCATLLLLFVCLWRLVRSKIRIVDHIKKKTYYITTIKGIRFTRFNTGFRCDKMSSDQDDMRRYHVHSLIVHSVGSVCLAPLLLFLLCLLELEVQLQTACCATLSFISCTDKRVRNNVRLFFI